MINGNGSLQGWVRTAIQIGTIAGTLLWGVGQIKSDVRDLDTRLTGRIAALSQHLDDLKVAADKEHVDLRATDAEIRTEINGLRHWYGRDPR